jgi:uncharacterized protein (DUF433 family)
MTLPPFLTEDKYGEIRLVGHRIGLFHVVVFYQEGYCIEMLSEEFPTLPRELIERVIAYYRANRAEVDDYVARYQQELDRQRATAPSGPSLEELQRRLAEGWTKRKP